MSNNSNFSRCVFRARAEIYIPFNMPILPKIISSSFTRTFDASLRSQVQFLHRRRNSRYFQLAVTPSVLLHGFSPCLALGFFLSDSDLSDLPPPGSFLFSFPLPFDFIGLSSGPDPSGLLLSSVGLGVTDGGSDRTSLDSLPLSGRFPLLLCPISVMVPLGCLSRSLIGRLVRRNPSSPTCTCKALRSCSLGGAATI